MNVGDFLYCKKTGIMEDSDDIFAYKGKIYEITKVIKDGMGNIKSIEITSEIGDEHLWRLNDPNTFEYFEPRKKTLWSPKVPMFNFI